MISDFLGGATSMGFAIAALLFLKFWQRTREGLFLAFAAAFLLLGVTQALLTLTRIPLEERSSLYLIRLAAFTLIIGALWWQNRKSRRSG
jgi:membrane-associated PAP2 superfamily phosphatase